MPDNLAKYLKPEVTMPTEDLLSMSKEELLQLDYDGKVKLLEHVAYELLDYRLELSKVQGRAAEIKANVMVLTHVKSALQSAIKAEFA